MGANFPKYHPWETKYLVMINVLKYSVLFLYQRGIIQDKFEMHVATIGFLDL